MPPLKPREPGLLLARSVRTKLKKGDKMNNEIIVQNQLTLMNDCFQCLQLNELCGECLEAKEARDSLIAYQMAEYGAVTESLPELSIIQDQPSGHDWTERASELREQTTWLVDRIFVLEDSIELTTHECICSVCHYTINKHAVCPNCN